MTASWRAALAAALGPIARADPVAGGDINDAYRVALADGRRVFVKTSAGAPPGAYAAEADGLAWLADGPLRVPHVLAVADSLLALEWLDLDRAPRDRSFDEQLGRGLAALHALGAPTFGLAHDNFLANLPQANAPAPDIATFWIERRLRPTIRRLPDHARLERALDRLPADRFGPRERPARLHGDLWSGNVGACAGAPVVFDPAVYGGHREIDLAMLALFGSVSDALTGAYHDVWPLEADWRDRLPLWQLYPLAVHAVLFGGGYAQRLARTLHDLQ